MRHETAQHLDLLKKFAQLVTDEVMNETTGTPPSRRIGKKTKKATEKETLAALSVPSSLDEVARSLRISSVAAQQRICMLRREGHKIASRRPMGFGKRAIYWIEK